ncbi:MAG: RsmB/NOP family class I SAM-dependent RNA methyltransferase [Bacteroidota bacterium]
MDAYARQALEALPPAFVERLAQIVPAARYEAVLATFAAPAPTGFRVNTLKATGAQVEAALADLPLQRVAWKPDAFWVPAEARAALLASEAYANQHLYVQNLASMIPPLVLDPQPGEHVLDLTAAPGSKTLQMACQMKDEGEIAAVEVVKGRFFKLRHNLEAQGATCVRTFLKDGTKVWRYRPEHFDRVLLDAPCSTEGRFHVSEPGRWAYWSLRKIKEMARKQQRLLFSAIQCLKPGGTLVYSTCSFAPEENERVLDKALRTFGEALTVEPLPLSLEALVPPLTAWQGTPVAADLSAARRLLPTPTLEGFFVALLRKHTSTLRDRDPGASSHRGRRSRR